MMVDFNLSWLWVRRYSNSITSIQLKPARCICVADIKQIHMTAPVSANLFKTEVKDGVGIVTFDTPNSKVSPATKVD